MSKKMSQWEKDRVNTLTLKLIFAATAGTLFATIVSYFIKEAGMAEIKPELLFAPWGVALVFGVSMAFHQGVECERERAEMEAQSKKKEG